MDGGQAMTPDYVAEYITVNVCGEPECPGWVTRVAYEWDDGEPEGGDGYWEPLYAAVPGGYMIRDIGTGDVWTGGEFSCAACGALVTEESIGRIIEEELRA